MDEEIDDLEKFVIGDLVVDEFLDLVEKGDFVGRGESLRSTIGQGERCLAVFTRRAVGFVDVLGFLRSC